MNTALRAVLDSRAVAPWPFGFFFPFDQAGQIDGSEDGHAILVFFTAEELLDVGIRLADNQGDPVAFQLHLVEGREHRQFLAAALVTWIEHLGEFRFDLSIAIGMAAYLGIAVDLSVQVFVAVA